MVELEEIMCDLGIDVLAIQETHRGYSEHFVTDSGYFYLLSGHDQEEREYAGVGFIVAPACRKCIIGFCAASNRMFENEILEGEICSILDLCVSQ